MDQSGPLVKHLQIKHPFPSAAGSHTDSVHSGTSVQAYKMGKVSKDVQSLPKVWVQV